MKSPVFTASFVDTYGIAHPQAQCFINNVTKSASLSFDEKAEQASQNIGVTYQVRFWHDAAAMEAGARNQDVMTKVGQMHFYINTPAADLTGVELLDYCAADFVENVVSTLNGVEQN